MSKRIMNKIMTVREVLDLVENRNVRNVIIAKSNLGKYSLMARRVAIEEYSDLKVIDTELFLDPNPKNLEQLIKTLWIEVEV